MRKSLIALLFFCCGVLLGQAPGTGTYNFGTFDSRGFDSVNVGNLNVHFSIPIVSRTGRGLPFQYNLVYDGLIWNPSSAGGVSGWTPDPTWGFHGQINNGTGLKGYITYRTTSVTCTVTGRGGHYPPTYRVSNFNYYDEFGRRHAFNYTFQAACPTGTPSNDVQTGDGSSSDGSGYSLNTGDYSQVLTRSGQSMTVPINPTGQNTMSITDPNGNSINGNGTGGFTDTLGVNALTINGSNPRTFTYPVTLQANNATTATATLSYQTYTVQTNFGCGIPDYPATATSLPSQLTLADGSTYQFSYEATPSYSGNVTGRLASVTLPTGGTIQYAYSGGCGGTGINTDGSEGILSRTTSDGTRSYSRAVYQGTSTSTDLVDEKGNTTHYIFSVDPNTLEFLETHRQVHQGSTNGAILMDQSTCYNGATNCDGGSVALPITEVDVTQSFNGGSQSITKNAYDSNGSLLLSSTLSNGQSTWTNTTNTYNANGEVLTAKQSDGNGTQYAGTTYGYDQTTPTSTSGVPQHTAQGGTPGNLTSIQVSTGSGTLNSSMTYYDTGQPVSSTAADGGVTTYGYDSTQGFLTSTALPTPASGVALSTSSSFDVNSTALLSSTGMAGDKATVNVYDGLMRPTDLTSASGSHIQITYDPNNFAHTTYQRSLDSNRTARIERLVDGYGRISRVAQYNGQASNPWYGIDYCYDGTGLLQFQSSPYQSTGFNVAKHCSGGGTTYSYDALGRVTSVTTNDGAGQNETTSTTYNNRAVQTVDPNNVTKITQYDIMGRITGVCEVSSTSYGGQSPTACGMDIPGNGYLTSYAYYLSTHTTTITQGGQTRTFVTDWAGRLVSAQEPERGTTTYSYSYNNQFGLEVTRTRPKANQTNPNVVTNTVTIYDKLSRVIGYTYDDGITKNRYFYFDTVPNSWMHWTSPVSNVAGRLAAANTDAGTISQYSYDVAGNVTDAWQCAPSICGTGNQQSRPTLHYTYDLSGAVMSGFDGPSGTVTYTRSAAGEITSVTNPNFNDSMNPTTLVSNVVNGAFGPTSWLLGSGWYGTKGYDALGRTTADFLCSGSSTIWCPGGTGAYGNGIRWKGSQVTQICDSTFGANCRNTTYDDLNRLTSLASSEGSNTYAYDRYGNRTVANGVGYSFNASTNQQVNNGYDAAGNQITDASHSYTYDAEGKVLQVDGGSTATYVYDAFAHRVRATTSASDLEYIYDPFGRRLSSWIVSSNLGNSGREYWDYGLLASRSYNGGTYFHQTNYLGTERVRTNWAGATTSTYVTGPYGEGGSAGIGTDTNQDPNGFTSQDHDPESGTDHFLYRQYSEGSGRWMSPDPYDGSYIAADPQSMNRYAYVRNNPLAYTDPDGTSDDGGPCGDPSIICLNGGGEGGGGAQDGNNGGHTCLGFCKGTDPNPTDGHPQPPNPCPMGSCVPFGLTQPSNGPMGGPVSATNGGSTTSNNSRLTNQPPKSPARQKCEADAQTQYEQSQHAIKSSVVPNLYKNTKTGVGQGAFGGCVGGAAAGSAAGILLTPAGATVGAGAGCAEGGLIGGVVDGLSSAFWSLGHSLYDITVTEINYHQQMEACSKL